MASVLLHFTAPVFGFTHTFFGFYRTSSPLGLKTRSDLPQTLHCVQHTFCLFVSPNRIHNPCASQHFIHIKSLRKTMHMVNTTFWCECLTRSYSRDHLCSNLSQKLPIVYVATTKYVMSRHDSICFLLILLTFEKDPHPLLLLLHLRRTDLPRFLCLSAASGGCGAARPCTRKV